MQMASQTHRKICAAVSRRTPFRLPHMCNLFPNPCMDLAQSPLACEPSVGLLLCKMIRDERRNLNPRPSVPQTDALPAPPPSRRVEFQSKQNGLQLIPRKTEHALPLSLKEFSVSRARKPRGTICPGGPGHVGTPGGLQ